MGEVDSLVLAEHDRRSGGGENASCWMALAAIQALDNGDFAGAIAHAAQGVADGATGEVLGTLRSVDASRPEVILRNVADPEGVHEIIRRAWLDARKRHGVQFRDQM